MSLNKYHDEYRKNDISTSNQGRLILMMYEGAMKFTTMALQCIDKGDIAGKGLYIQKTLNIVSELSVSLDMKKGGEVAQRLETLYQYVLNQLTAANIKSDRQALESILNVLTPLYEAWSQLFDPHANPNNQQPHPAKTITSKI